MKTTVDLPDDLARRAKAEAALRGRKLKDLVEEALRRLLDGPRIPESHAEAPVNPSVYDLMKDGGGIVESGLGDLASNPGHMEGFGRD